MTFGCICNINPLDLHPSLFSFLVNKNRNLIRICLTPLNHFPPSTHMDQVTGTPPYISVSPVFHHAGQLRASKLGNSNLTWLHIWNEQCGRAFSGKQPHSNWFPFIWMALNSATWPNQAAPLPAQCLLWSAAYSPCLFSHLPTSIFLVRNPYEC